MHYSSFNNQITHLFSRYKYISCLNNVGCLGNKRDFFENPFSSFKTTSIILIYKIEKLEIMAIR